MDHARPSFSHAYGQAFFRPLLFFIVLASYFGFAATSAWADWTQDGTNINSAYASMASIAVNNTTPYVAYEETAGTDQIYVKYWNGNAWSPVGGSLNKITSDFAFGPSLAFYDNAPYVAWSEFSNGGSGVAHIYVRRWTGAWEMIGNSLNTVADHDAGNPSIVVAAGIPYVAFQETNGTNFQVMVKSWSGSVWQWVGSYLNVNLNRAADVPRLAMSSGGTLYVTWRESSSTTSKYQVYVRRWSSPSWTQLGSSLNLSTSQDSYDPRIAISGTTPYVAWSENNASGHLQLYVKYYNGSSWLHPGGLTDSLNNSASRDARIQDLGFNSTGTPHVLWKESDGSYDRFYVKQWTGSTWALVGTSIQKSADQNGQNASLAFVNETPYVAWTEAFAATRMLYAAHYVPPTFTPSPTASITRTRTRTPTRSATQTATLTRTALATNTSIASPTPTPTGTLMPAATQTPTPTCTPSWTATLPSMTVTLPPRHVPDSSLKLFRNKINPIKHEQVRICWSQPEDTTATIAIYNLLGDKVATLVKKDYPAGQIHEITWDGCTQEGDPVGSGIYIVYLKAGHYEAKEKIAVLK